MKSEQKSYSKRYNRALCAFIFNIRQRLVYEVLKLRRTFFLFLEKNQYTYTWPFSTHNPSHEELLAQIKKDEIAFRPEEKVSELTQAIAKREVEITKGWSLMQQKNPSFKKISDTNVFLTFYGPHGYFDAPDKIYVNIAMGHPRFWLETILHEAIHLLTQNTESSEHESEESLVDDLFIMAFGNIFPSYQKQEFKKDI